MYRMVRTTDYTLGQCNYLQSRIVENSKIYAFSYPHPTEMLGKCSGLAQGNFVIISQIILRRRHILDHDGEQ